MIAVKFTTCPASCCFSPEMCSAENIMGSKLMLAGVKFPTKDKDEPLLKDDTLEPTKPTKGSSFKQVSLHHQNELWPMSNLRHVQSLDLTTKVFKRRSNNLKIEYDFYISFL